MAADIITITFCHLMIFLAQYYGLRDIFSTFTVVLAMTQPVFFNGFLKIKTPTEIFWLKNLFTF